VLYSKHTTNRLFIQNSCKPATFVNRVFTDRVKPGIRVMHRHATYH